MASPEFINPVSGSIIREYQAVADAYNNLWQAIEVRTNGSDWRVDGLGSCGIGKTLSEKGIEGPAKADMIRLRELRNAQTPGESKYCPNHRVGKGCVLGDLKSPFCLGFIDPALFDELPDRFGIGLLGIRKPLIDIQTGNVDDETVKNQVLGIEVVINYIKTFPILHPEEVR